MAEVSRNMRRGIALTGVLVFVLGMIAAGVAGCGFNYIPGAVAGGAVAVAGFVTIGYGACTSKPTP